MKQFVILLLCTILFLPGCRKTNQIAAKYHTFKIVVNDTIPDFDITPHHARMSSCYRDNKGEYHLFVDYVDAALDTLASWEAEIYYYKSHDLKKWTFVEKAVPKGRTLPKKELDYYGAASPGVLATDSLIYLFYAGRYLTPDNKVNCRIFLATARANPDGAPAEPFVKQGMMIDLGSEGAWDCLRLDDPCPVIRGDSIYVYFKGLSGGHRDSIMMSVASASLKDMVFKKNRQPIFRISGGLEMPRVFRYENQWHMFVRSFDPGENYLWQHYASPDGLDWQPVNTTFWNKTFPTGGASDMVPVFSFNNQLTQPPLVIATGLEGDAMKLWFLDLRTEKQK